jgi:YHS domain-containing protein
MKSVSSCIVLLLALALPACDEPAGPKPASVETAATTKPAEVSLGFSAACPLCVGHEIEVMSDTPTAEFEGKTYYFCSKSCQKAFNKDPAGSVKKSAAAATQPGH